MAFRYVLPPGAGGREVIRAERSEFRPAGESVAWPIYEAEETFPTEPVPLALLKTGAHTPLTVRTAGGRRVRARGERGRLPADASRPDRRRCDSLRGFAAPPRRRAGFATPWRVVLLGPDEASLVENEHLVLSLNPSCAIADTSWVRPGKTISNEGSAPLETTALEAGRRLRGRERHPLPAARLGLVRDRVDVD